MPGKLGNDDNEWSDGMDDEANEDLPFIENETAPEELALHIIDPMDENPDAESQHTERSDAIPHDMAYDEQNASGETQECAHPSCHCQVSQSEFCSGNCESPDTMESSSCNCTHVGCESEMENELVGLQEIQGENL
ncbi:hypothetical protein KA183_01865 [bacterium]|nr:hypothetical protein [bacterium]QQR56970.1 MAG: hypothetical protein IPG59_18555 [Candidatus Melainabacteria bacterium]